MKEDEKIFFKICLKYVRKPIGEVRIREIINILHDCGFMNYKRCRYLLKKWCIFGFYNYGISLDLGWFELDKLPQQYFEILQMEEGLK